MIDIWTVSYIVLWVLVLLEGVAIIVLLRQFGAIYLGSRAAINRDGLLVDTPAPDFTGMDQTGKAIPLSSLLGQWLVLVFAAPACADCYKLVPSLEALQDDLAGMLRVVFLVRGHSDDSRTIPELQGTRITVLAIGADGVADDYRVRVSPFVHVLDAEGIVRGKGLVNNRGRLEHLLADAGLEHPALIHQQHHHDHAASAEA